MNLGLLPELVSSFDLELELAALLNDVPTLSNNQWTDTSASDPGVIAIRKALEAQQALLYQASVRYLPDTTVLHLARLKGLSPNAANPARTLAVFTVVANTTIQTGLVIASEFTSLEYEVVTGVTSVAGGLVTLEIKCRTAGSAGNTGGDPLPPVGMIRTVRTAPSAGTILTVRDVQPASGGREAETLEEFALRLPDLIRDDTLHMPSEFLSEISNFPDVKRAAIWRATKPVAPGVFARAPGQMTVVLMGAGGATPAPSVITAVSGSLFGKSYFNNLGDNPLDAGIFVIGNRIRNVGVSGTIYVNNQTDRADIKIKAQNLIAAYLNPETGGEYLNPNTNDETGAGWALGVQPFEDAIITRLRTKLLSLGLTRVDNDSIIISNSAELAIDEVIAAGTMNFTVLYG
jgi:Baseplate J-like protein